MVRREPLRESVRTALRRTQVVLLAGPRQSGKTTLARQFVAPGAAVYFDLENPADLARLTEPMTALEPLRGIVVLDEIQRRPELFPVLRVLADRRPIRTRFLVLGSASGALLQQSSESLAGRLAVIEIGGLELTDVPASARDRLWRRGGFPRAFLARTDTESWTWRDQFIRTFLERDVPQLGGPAAAHTLRRFWTMVAHYHGQIWNHAEPARSLGVSEMTVRRYLDLMSDVFMIRQLRPWHANLSKRQVKSPKVYVRDSGLLHYLLGLRTWADLHRHPKFGASWEGFVVETLLTALRPDEAYFWATHQGAELDLLLLHRGKRWGVEIKRADAPELTKSMQIAQADLALDHLAVIYPGRVRFRLGRKSVAVPAEELRSVRWGTLSA